MEPAEIGYRVPQKLPETTEKARRIGLAAHTAVAGEFVPGGILKETGAGINNART